MLVWQKSSQRGLSKLRAGNVPDRNLLLSKDALKPRTHWLAALDQGFVLLGQQLDLYELGGQALGGRHPLLENVDALVDDVRVVGGRLSALLGCRLRVQKGRKELNERNVTFEGLHRNGHRWIADG
jgi:hypothetical protein